MTTTLLKSVFMFQRGLKRYTVEFNNSTKRWYIYKVHSGDKIVGPPLEEIPWNGIRVLPTGDDAEEKLHEHLKIDE